ncbi:hypothetical protein [Sorangium sp. So ce233]|uniref:hypothetical protein n=1 Tax=Sorangium sp. So ce233 TaxID=3133290 RepID=UPI003F64280F
MLISSTRKISSGSSAITPHLDAAATAAQRVARPTARRAPGRAPELADRLGAAS